MICMDVDTALSEVPVNYMPLIDDTDFKTREESVTYDQAGMDLVWNFVTTAGAFTQTAVTPTTGGDYDWTNQGNGMYTIEIPASGGASINNDTEGYGWFTGYATGILPWSGPVICLRASGINDKLVDSAYDTNRGLAGLALPAAAADGAGGLPISDAGGLALDTLLGYLDAAITSRLATAGYTAPDNTNITNIHNIVNHADYGNAQLVRSTAPANKLDVSATGEAGLDFDNIKDATGAHTLTNITVPTVTTTGTCTTNTDMRGTDSAATEAKQDIIDTIVDAIKAVTDVLNNLSSADIQTIIENNNLDHLCKIATAAADMTAEIADNSILSRILANGDTSAFDPSTDGLQPIRDRGDVSWITGAGGDATAANQTTIINSLTAAKGATFDTATDSLEAIRNRGDAAWTSGSLSGANTVTITVNDGDGNPIIDVDVQIWNNAVDAFLTKDRSDSNGQFIFTADDNTYKVKLKKAGYTFNSTETLVVSGDTSDTYVGTSNESTTPASSDVCRVYEYIKDPDGNYPAEVNAIVNITTLPHDDGSSLYSGEKYDGVYDPDTGKVYWDVVKGAVATFKIINYGINLNVTVPSDVDTVRLTDI